MKNKVQRKIEPELLGVADAEAMTGRSRWTWRRDCYSAGDCFRKNRATAFYSSFGGSPSYRRKYTPRDWI